MAKMTQSCLDLIQQETNKLPLFGEAPDVLPSGRVGTDIARLFL